MMKYNIFVNVISDIIQIIKEYVLHRIVFKMEEYVTILNIYVILVKILQFVLMTLKI